MSVTEDGIKLWGRKLAPQGHYLRPLNFRKGDCARAAGHVGKKGLLGYYLPTN